VKSETSVTSSPLTTPVQLEPQKPTDSRSVTPDLALIKVWIFNNIVIYTIMFAKCLNYLFINSLLNNIFLYYSMLTVYIFFIDCLLLLMACVSYYQKENSATEDSENDDKVKLCF